MRITQNLFSLTSFKFLRYQYLYFQSTIEIKQQSRVIKHYFFYLFIHDAHQILLWWWTQNTQDVVQLIQVCEHNACQGQEMFY